MRLRAGMEAEHCERPDSRCEFRSANYGTITTGASYSLPSCAPTVFTPPAYFLPPTSQRPSSGLSWRTRRKRRCVPSG